MIQQSKLKLEEKLVQFAKDNSKEERKEPTEQTVRRRKHPLWGFANLQAKAVLKKQ
jgi:hypothetical protein